LENAFGNITVKGMLLFYFLLKLEAWKQFPLLVYARIKEASAFLLGENVWKWRLQSHLDTQSFAKFDVLWIKQFSIWHLVALKALVVNHESFIIRRRYRNNSTIF
jgi:hypothetical protein